MWHEACSWWLEQRWFVLPPPGLPVGDRDRIDAIAAAILEHLRRFPNARDTVRGVHDWWLGPELDGATLAEVESALWRLVAAERLVAVFMPDGGTLFAKAPADGPRLPRTP